MSYLIKPVGYKPLLDMKQTELGIKQIKEFSNRTSRPNFVYAVLPLLCSF